MGTLTPEWVRGTAVSSDFATLTSSHDPEMVRSLSHSSGRHSGCAMFICRNWGLQRMNANPFPTTAPVRSRELDFFGSVRRRVLVSIAASAGWLCLVLLYLAFWATGFSLLQSIVVVVVSLLILAAVLLGAWISFGLRFVGRWD